MYAKGEGVKKDVAKSVEFWEKAAAQRKPERPNPNTTKMYEKGDGVPKNAVKAVEWWQKAATQGDANAQFKLGRMYGSGRGVPQDTAKEFEWTQKAAALGHSTAQSSLSSMYSEGEGVSRDYVLAYAWLNLMMGQVASGGINIKYFDFVKRMNAAQVAEAQRLSSSWKKGQVIVREVRSDQATVASIRPGILTKKGTGTLFLVSGTGQAITNDHVVAGCSELRIERS